MFQEGNYEAFIKYLRDTLNENQNKQENRLEVLNDFYFDYPPEGMINDDSDSFNEEIQHLAQNDIITLEAMIYQNDSHWVISEGDKWRLLEDEEEVVVIEQSILKQKLELTEIDLLASDISDSNRKAVENLYNGKVLQYGNDDEKYNLISKIAKYYNKQKTNRTDYIPFLVEAGEMGAISNQPKSYKYFEFAAKHYRSIYEHRLAAESYGKAFDSAEKLKADHKVLIALARNAKIQYDLCSDGDCASKAFINENKYKLKGEAKKHKKFILSTLGVLSDYCQNPLKVSLWALLLIIISAVVYSFSGISSNGLDQNVFTPGKCSLLVVMDSIYFSIVTFSTLGYGDFSPSNGVSRVFATIEALGGLFFTSLFLVTLVRKYGR
jgi:hypothetical protein